FGEGLTAGDSVGGESSEFAPTRIATPKDAVTPNPRVRSLLLMVDMRRGALKPPPGIGSTRRSLGKEISVSGRDGGGTVDQPLEFVKVTSGPLGVARRR